jgi:hypothetical protein
VAREYQQKTTFIMKIKPQRLIGVKALARFHITRQFVDIAPNYNCLFGLRAPFLSFGNNRLTKGTVQLLWFTGIHPTTGTRAVQRRMGRPQFAIEQVRLFSQSI